MRTPELTADGSASVGTKPSAEKRYRAEAGQRGQWIPSWLVGASKVGLARREASMHSTRTPRGAGAPSQRIGIVTSSVEAESAPENIRANIPKACSQIRLPRDRVFLSRLMETPPAGREAIQPR